MDIKKYNYVEQPQEFIAKGREDKVYRIKKELYGLKQGYRASYFIIDNYLHEHDHEQDLLNILLRMSSIKRLLDQISPFFTSM